MMDSEMSTQKVKTPILDDYFIPQKYKRIAIQILEISEK